MTVIPDIEIAELSAGLYRRHFPIPSVIYNSTAFTSLNSYKVSEVKRLVFYSGGKPRLGLTVGVRADGSVAAPFSAPFACFDFNRRQCAAVMLAAARALRSYLPGMTFTLPPDFYAPSMIAKTGLALLQAGATLLYSDWNYHLPLYADTAAYLSTIGSYERNILARASRQGFRLVMTDDDPLRSYRVITANHSLRGYPVRMSAEQVLATASDGGPVDGHFFVITNGEVDVAAAIVFDVTSDISQVIYWGDVPDNRCRYAMNLLAAGLADYYGKQGRRILDIGPASERGEASTGLCSFKESVGCIASGKLSFML